MRRIDGGTQWETEVDTAEISWVVKLGHCGGLGIMSDRVAKNS